MEIFEHIRFIKTLLTTSLVFLLVLVGLTRTMASPVVAAPPTDFQSQLIIGSGLTAPTAFDWAPDGRLFILEREGNVRIYKNGQLLTQAFTNLPSVTTGDRGLIGIAFDPSFDTNHWVYFYYTGTDLLNRLMRFDASGDIGTNGTVLFQTSSPSTYLHVGGSIRFGPDGKLYFAVGDNGYPPNAQDLTNPHGKILRINKDGSVPTDNPFYGQAGKVQEIWAYGFRNPWRFNFDEPTGKLYVGDVGADTTEELDLVNKGGNYGWPNVEGKCPTACPYVDPIYTYDHNGVSSAITAGPVYRGSMFPLEYQGNIFIGDYARNFIRRLVQDGNDGISSAIDFDTNPGAVVDIKIAVDGSLYYVEYQAGQLWRISYNPTNPVPVAQSAADRTTGLDPLTVTFSSAGSNDPKGETITFDWDFGDGTAHSQQANPSHTYPNKGTYTVTLRVSDGTNTTQALPLTIQVGTPPTVTVTSPSDGSNYRAGDTINWSAQATAGPGGTIDATSYKTYVIFHHHTHIHPFLGPLSGQSGNFATPTTGEPDPDTWFEIKVTVTDNHNLATTKSVFIYPLKANLTLATDPAALQVTLDGIPITTPLTLQQVQGFQREVNTVGDIEKVNNQWYKFDHWSDGGAQKHLMTVPQADSTLTATFVPTQCSETTTPTNFSPVGTIDPGTRNITWDPQTGATAYALRVDDQSNAWTGSCTELNPGDVCRNDLTTNTYPYDFQPGKTYNMWLHAVNSCGVYSDPAPQQVTVNACSTVTTPVNVQPSGTTAEGNKPITWDPVPGATGGYAIRIDDQSNPWNDSCTNLNPGDACSNTVATNSFPFNFVAGHSYNVWIHAINSCGVYSPVTPQVITTQAACQAVTAPTNLQPTAGATTPGTKNITWNTQSGAAKYALRIDDRTNPWNGSCTAPNAGDVCTDVATNSYSFNFVPGKTYNIWVHAVNSCGTISTQAESLVTTSFLPTADAYVSNSATGTNFGTAQNLLVDGSPLQVSYLKFDLASLAGKTITSATLRLKVNDASTNTQSVKAVSSTSWVENTINWNNRPAVGTSQATITSSTVGTVKDIDLTTYIRSKLGQQVSIGIDSTGADSVGFVSREGATDKPQLIVQ